ncbi:G patch domain-containing protein 3 [Taenia crassiceps]|uniref:G patch domain-containing protein 3 n=1 Tax=Taenia crassiceps TaxID=6207 RepID=A0ABR4QGK0_9CEST
MFTVPGLLRQLVFGPTLVRDLADLRRIFSQHIEAGAFTCFHYRHRPSSSRLAPVLHCTVDAETLLHVLKRHRSRRAPSCTTLVAMKPGSAQNVLASVEDSWFTDAKCGDFAPCRFHRVIWTPLQLNSLKKLCEFSPPSWMPHGNVGTPISHFISLIRSCRLGSDTIRRLKLDLLCFRSSRKYGSVSYVYPDSVGKLDSIVDTEVDAGKSDFKTQSRLVLSNPVDTDDVAEEWDRFEVLHNDPYDVDRSSKHSLKYESRIELKWEKGGSGLVHYTDEMFWRERESVRNDEFFDEPSSFDWDINLHQYSDDEGLSFMGPGGPDLDSKQLSQVLDESNEDCEKPFLSAFGARIMQSQGWRRGTRLGDPKRKGLLEPLTSEDSSVSTNRSGLGFAVTSSRPSPIRRRFSKFAGGVYIRSAFDGPGVVALRSSTAYHDKRPQNRRDLNDYQSTSREKRLVINNPYSSLGIEGVKFEFGGLIH